MHLRYFYRQLASFLIVILITIAVLSVTLIQSAKDTIYTEVERNLKDVMGFIVSQNAITPSYLDQLSPLLKRWNVSVVYVDENNKRLYPYEDSGMEDTQLTDEEYAKLRRGETLSLRAYDIVLSRHSEDRGSMSVFQPLESTSGEYRGYLAVGTLNTGIETEIASLRSNINFGLLVSGGVAIVLSFIFARYQNRRIGRLRNATRSVIEGNYDTHIENEHRDEFDELATDFNQMIDSLKESQNEIDRQEALRRQMMMDVAHEMRTPLTTMNGVLEGLKYHVIPEEKKERSVELLHNETQRLIRLVNENLDYEKIQANEIHLNRTPFLLAPLFEEIYIQLKENASKKQDTILVDVADSTVVYADPDRFRQIIVNILQNAIQFTEHGTIELRAKQLEEQQLTEIRIKDSGIGMNQEQVDNIWERFYKADESRKNTVYGESGLGLSIVKGLVSAHGAQIEVESEENVGTIFTLYFPSGATKLNTDQESEC